MTVDITEIVVAIIGLLSAILTAAVLPWLRMKLGAQKLEQLQCAARIAVGAAEQLFGAGLGKDKLTYAAEQLRALLARQGIEFDEDAIHLALEAAVREL